MPAQTNEERAKDLKNFGRKLAEKRMAARVTKQVLAERCGLSYKHYFNIENGTERPSLLTYIAICRVLGIPLPLISG